MSLMVRLLGLILTTIGISFSYGIYLFVLNIYTLLSWLSTYINAPESLAIVLTVLIIIALLGVFILAIVIIVYLIFIGLTMIFNGSVQVL